jgi:hypothetical protein
MIRNPTAGALMLILLVAAAGGRAAAEAGDSDHVGHRHRVVPITSQRLYPDVQRISVSDAFGWLNYSTMIARVSFDREVVDRLTCRSASRFHPMGDRFESGDIGPGEFTTLCSLAAGEYFYRVELRATEGPGDNADLVTHAGKIIVE